MGGRRWTDGERRRLKGLADAGYSQREAAAELGRPWSGLRFEAGKLRVRFSPGVPDAAKQALVLDLLGKGLTVAAIARLLGRCRGGVCRRVKALERDGLIARAGGKAVARRYVVIVG